MSSRYLTFSVIIECRPDGVALLARQRWSVARARLQAQRRPRLGDGGGRPFFRKPDCADFWAFRNARWPVEYNRTVTEAGLDLEMVWTDRNKAN